MDPWHPHLRPEGSRTPRIERAGDQHFKAEKMVLVDLAVVRVEEAEEVVVSREQ
jgi:hypothetical protein